MSDSVHSPTQSRASRPATSVIVASSIIAGILLAVAFAVGEARIRDELVAALVIPGAVAIVVAMGVLIALGKRGDRWTPLRMFGAWALLVPLVDALATFCILVMTSERLEYIGHAVVQSAVRAEVAVGVAGLVLFAAWLRGRLREVSARSR